jgi:putative hemolysin
MRMIDSAWLIALLLLAVDLLLAATRSGLVNARVPQLLSLREQSPAAVDRVLGLLEKPRLRATLRLMVVLSHAFVVLFVWWAAVRQWSLPSQLGWLALIGFLTVSVLLIFEFGIERLLLRQPEAAALALTPVAVAMDFLLRPLAAGLLAVQGMPAVLERQPGAMTEDELKTWVEVGEPQGGLEKDERRMIYSIFQFGDTLCREIMIPRVDVLALDVDTALDQAIQALVESGHSRVPVYQNTIDNVVGVLYAKDLLRIRPETGQDGSIRDLLRTAYFVPESKKVDDLLAEMQARGVHVVIVVDEYGGMAGLVTLEDIVEQIVGEIRDEYDQGEELPYQEINPEEFLVSGRLDVEDLNEILGTHLNREQADTLGGYIYGAIGRMPAGGEQVQLEDWLLTVEQVRGRQIRQVRVRKNHRSEELE